MTGGGDAPPKTRACSGRSDSPLPIPKQGLGGHPPDDVWVRAAVRRGALNWLQPPRAPVALLFRRVPPSVAAARYGDPWAVDLMSLPQAAAFSTWGSA
jgi:hypothetical protein